MIVTGFDWDTGNRSKCQKHGMTIRDIEAFFRSHVRFVAPDIKHSESEARFLAVGRMPPNNRPVFVAFTMRDDLIRPISARYMHEKEAKLYEQNEQTETSQNDH
ncbi:MAG: BrnT family toxin [Symploca sp. SIO2G7]|nr:BrnT family toxin [Symploca sp. SIO2G7]